jgi:hypothetical protein
MLRHMSAICPLLWLSTVPFMNKQSLLFHSPIQEYLDGFQVVLLLISFLLV